MVLIAEVKKYLHTFIYENIVSWSSKVFSYSYRCQFDPDFIFLNASLNNSIWEEVTQQRVCEVKIF